MAQIPFQNFAFTDPVAAQQAVQMGQLLTLAQAEKDRNMANYAQETLRQRTAQQNAAAQRAIQQGQLNQQIAEANANRQARATETDKVLASQEKVAGMNLQGRNDYKSGNEKFDSIAALIDSEDPPTDSEFNALSEGLPPDRKLPLKQALLQKRRALGALASEAQQLSDFWNSKFDAVPTGDDRTFSALKTEFMKDRRANELLQKDPRWTGFRTLPKYKGPRLDAPPESTIPGVTSIDELRSRVGIPAGARDINQIQPGGIMVPRLPAGVVNDIPFGAAPQPAPAFQVPIPTGY